ncbi:Arrestin-related trafficking adapter 3 [Leucoagaricus sp. SymC.cos]|nr:Arrestin-related trafficking adapter 3 [Leucoagaricus sp. SymC.cos]
MPHTLDQDLAPKSKNSLTIRLTESAVFLRSDCSIHDNAHTEERASILRGLLILNLAKPTKISGIEIELVGKTETAWPEGVGASRIEVTEEHRFFHASATFFEAQKAHSRRATSIGPGVAARDHDPHHDDWEESHPSPPPRPRDSTFDDVTESVHTSNEDLPLGRLRLLRNASVDASHYHPHHVAYHEERLPHVPPYSPLPDPLASAPSSTSVAPSPLSSSNSFSQDPSPAHSLEEFRAALNRERNMFAFFSAFPVVSPARSPSTSTQNYSPSHRDFSVSRQPSMDGVPEDDIPEDMPEQIGYSRNVYRGSHTPRQNSPLPPTESDRDRGRRNRSIGRFTLANVSHVLMDAVRATSPMLARSRERSKDDRGSVVRGRTMDKKSNVELASPRAFQQEAEGSNTRGKTSKDHHLFDKFGEILKLDVTESKEHKDVGRDWKEFKKGVYTYPISFQVPADSPPTLVCDYGVVTWHLRAHVHRPGPFRPKYTAERPVIVVSCPTEDDIEETENIIIERHWDHQLQYLIAVSGRSFYIGGTLPVTFTMLPLGKARVHRIAVYLEERIDYYTNMCKIARSDPVTRYELLFIRNEGKNAPVILPLESDDPEAFRKSPFYAALSSQFKDDSEISELASSFMGPGPWSFHFDLKLPKSCNMLKPTNKNKRANMVVSHLLKLVMRMERGDEKYVDKNGKKKLFDIVVQTPIHILSCRCNPEWASLPRYSESLHQVEHVIRSCPCRTPQDSHPHPPADTHHVASMYRPTLERTMSRDSTDSNVSAADDQPIDGMFMASLRPPGLDDLVMANTLFERLVSGQQSEMGETPPAYEMATTQHGSTVVVSIS